MAQSENKPLQGKIAVVTGATRNAGRGVAIELGIAGATVYCTGRSTRGNPSPLNEPETIEETAEMVDASGGRGIWVRVDHTVPGEVETLFDRVLQEQGRLDLLVNNVSGGAVSKPLSYSLPWKPVFSRSSRAGTLTSSPLTSPLAGWPTPGTD